MNDQCARAASMMPLWMDHDLAADEQAWLDQHLTTCEECPSLLNHLKAIDGELTHLGRRLAAENPAPPGARAQISARFEQPEAQHNFFRLIPAVATAIAAGITLFSIGIGTPQKHTPPSGRAQNYFIEIPYLPPPSPQESLAVVRMEIRVGTLMSMGYRVAADPEAIVPAEVLVGEDGRAHAVHVLSDVQLTGAGD